MTLIAASHRNSRRSTFRSSLRVLFTLKVLAALGVWTLLSSVAAADLITFGTGAIDGLLAAGAQTEGSYTYEALSGDGWDVGDVYPADHPFPGVNPIGSEVGNPGSALATFFSFPPDGSVGSTVEIRRTDNGLFEFNSVDWRTVLASNTDAVDIIGYLGNDVKGTLSLNGSSTTYATAASGFATEALTRLEIVQTADAVPPPPAAAMLLDNFNLTLVPEPATFSLAALAGVLILSTRRRQGVCNR